MKLFITLAIVSMVTLANAKTIKTYYNDDTIKSVTTYKNSKKNGVEHIYYPDGATLKYARNYEYGKLHGLQQEYSKNAMLIKEESYKHGKLDGVSRYYDNGLLQKEITYKWDVKDGKYREFFPSGIVKLEIIWDRGRAVEGFGYSQTGDRSCMSSQSLNLFSKRDKK